METDSDSSYRSAGDSVAVSGSGVPSLHAAIMNLRSTPPQWEGPTHTTRSVAEAAYHKGHRDARHAAAELVSAQESFVEELVAALAELAVAVSWPQDNVDAAISQARSVLLKATGAPHAE